MHNKREPPKAIIHEFYTKPQGPAYDFRGAKELFELLRHVEIKNRDEFAVSNKLL